MSLRIASVEWTRGWLWVRNGLALLFKNVVGFTLLLLVGLLPTLVLAAVPAVGPLLAFAMGPVITLGFAVGAREAQAGRPVRAAQMLEPALPGADRTRRRRLLALSLAYAASVALVVAAMAAGSGEALEQLAAAQRGDSAELSARLREVLAAHPGLRALMLLGVMVLTLVSALFWHAPMLVWWHGQGVAQALFSSALACWRNKGAFLVYTLAWAGLMLLMVVVSDLLAAALGSGPMAALATQPLMLLSMAAYYTSVYFSHVDCFVAETREDGASGTAASG